MEFKPGFGFRPYDEELVGYYLPHKILGNTSLVEEAISEVNIYSVDPWNLRFQSKIKSRDPVWYFFYRIESNYLDVNHRQSRTTPSGSWKLTGEPVDVKDQWGMWGGSPGKIGFKRVLVFGKGKSSEKGKSEWVIHELHCTFLPEEVERTYVICRLDYKGDDLSILSAYATDPTSILDPNMPNSECSVIDQSLQVDTGSYNPYSQYNSANLDQQFSANFDMMQQSAQGNSGYFNYSDPDINAAEKSWYDTIAENYDYLVDQRPYMQQNYSDYRPKKPVTGAFPIDSSDSDSDSMICGDTSSSTDSVGSSNGLHIDEAQEQPKQLKLQLQGQQKMINMQKSERMWKMAEESVKKAPSTSGSWVVLETMSIRKSQWNYLKNIIIGFLLIISIFRWIILAS